MSMIYLQCTSDGIESNLNEEILAPVPLDDDIRWLRLYHPQTFIPLKIHKFKYYTKTNAQIHKYKSLYTYLNEEILAPISVDDDIRWLRLYHWHSYHITSTQIQIQHKYKCSNIQIYKYKSLFTNLNEGSLAPVSLDDDIRWLRLYHQVTLWLLSRYSATK